MTWEQQTAWPDAWTAWRQWRSALDALGVAVFMFADVPIEEVRGLLLPRNPLPVVAVNTREVVDARAYTAMHEVVHLMLTNAHEEEPALTDRHSARQWNALERFAEAAASFTLIAEDALAAGIETDGVPLEIPSMRMAARRFRVTPLALATRLLHSGYMNEDQYRDWRGEWDAYVRALPKATGFATPVSKALGRGGISYAQLVLEALDTNRIAVTEAARYLNLHVDRFDQLRQRLVTGNPPEGNDE